MQATQRGRAAMCQMCVYAEHDADPWGVGAVECTISGRPVNYHVISPQPTCPKGKHGTPTKPRQVKWAGLEWRGVPAPIRWVLFWRLTGPLQGCGCTCIGKRLVARLRWWRRTMTRGVHG